MSEPYVPQLIYYPERDEYEFVTEDVTTVERALVPDDSVGLLLRMEEPREVIGFRIAGALVRRVSPLSDGDGWQPIETGQDGRRVDVLLTNGTVKYGVRWGEDEGEYDDREPGWVDDATGKFVRGEDEEFTHWRPSATSGPREEVA